MRKIAVVFLILALLSSFVSCKEPPAAERLLSEFMSLYSLEGVVYSPERKVGEDGYVYEGLTERIFVYEGDFPLNYAVLLNSRTSEVVECGVFVCSSDEERMSVEEMCRERIILLLGSMQGGLIIRSGRTVFYSTLDDAERAEDLWRKIIRAYS